MKKLLVAAAVAAAFTMPAEAETIELQIHDACAAFAPLSVAQRGKCTQILMDDNKQFVAQSETPTGKRVMANCESAAMASDWRYVELRMCFRKAYQEEARAQESVRAILADIPETANARKAMAEPCIKELEQNNDYTAALQCLQDKDVLDAPFDVQKVQQLAEAMGSGNLKPFKLDNFLKSLNQ